MTANHRVTVFGIAFDVEFECTPYIPAKTSGPLEQCRPAEGGTVEITQVYIYDSDVDILGLLADSVFQKIKAEVIEHIVAEAPADLTEYAKREEAACLEPTSTADNLTISGNCAVAAFVDNFSTTVYCSKARDNHAN